MNNPTLSDVTFLVEGQKFHAHRIALLASSDTFRAMFDGHYREKDASEIPIPNIRYEVFRKMMTCAYTGEAPSFTIATPGPVSIIALQILVFSASRRQIPGSDPTPVDACPAVAGCGPLR